MKRILFIIFFLAINIFMLFSQSSQIPQGNRYLQNAGELSSGDRDRVNVIFFEIPDSVGASTMLYFGIYDSGIDDTLPDTLDEATLDTFYYLIGGSGALSHPYSKLIDYSSDTSQARVGTLLSSFTADETAGYNNNWYYFPNAVRADQGEKIGNKYYFKIVVEIDTTSTGINKNGYQADVSFAPSTTPTAVSGARSFMYSWSVVFLNNVGFTWDFYPFVPDNAVDNIVFRSFEMDGSETCAGYNVTGTYLGAVSVSPDSGYNALSLYGVDPSPYSTFPIGTERDGTWNLRVTETTGNPADGRNTSEIYSYNSPNNGSTVGEYYRIYSSHIPKPPSPTYDHVALSYDDGIAVTGTLDTDKGETVVLQIVDVNNNPVSYSRNIYVYFNNGSARIMSSNNSPIENSIDAVSTVVTTDSTGMGWVKIKDGTAEIVQLSLLTNGTNGSENFGIGTDDTVYIDFVLDPDPTLVSANNQTFTKGAGATTIPQLTITNTGTSSKLTNSYEIYIRIPSSLDCSFDTSVTNPTFGGTASGRVDTVPPPVAPVSYPDSKTMIIYLQSDFLTDEYITVSGLRMQDFNTESSGKLEMSFLGGGAGTYTVIDPMVYSILDNAAPIITGRETADLDGDGFIDAIHITFSKAINDTTVLSAVLGGEFAITGASNLTFSSTTNGDTANDTDIYITFDDGDLDTGQTPNLNYTGSTVQDLAGNLLGTSNIACTDRASPVLTSVTLSNPLNNNGAYSGDTIVFIYNESLSAGSISSSLILGNVDNSFTAGSGNITGTIENLIAELGGFATAGLVTGGSCTLELSADGTTLTITLDNTITNRYGTFPGGVFTPANTYTDSNSNTINIGVTQSASGTWDDTDLEIVSVTLNDPLNNNGAFNGDTMTIVFSEPSLEADALVGRDNTITGQDLTTILNYIGTFDIPTTVTADNCSVYLSADGMTVIITLGGTITNRYGVFPGGNLTPSNSFHDLYGNVIDTAVTPTVTGSWDTTNPQLVSVTLYDTGGNNGAGSSDTIEFVYNEPISASSITLALIGGNIDNLFAS
ncbi:MAG: hypothetical protein JXB50_13505, partial [Spirochaetes bacterium]|nr:hypothetical protein [Spirochaetota bacterium]